MHGIEVLVLIFTKHIISKYIVKMHFYTFRLNFFVLVQLLLIDQLRQMIWPTMRLFKFENFYIALND